MRGRAGAALAALLLLLAPAGLRAQTGFTPAGAERLAEREAHILATIEPDSLAAWSRALSARPHVAGSPAQLAVAEWLLDRLRDAGLAAETAEYRVFLPWAERVSLRMVAPDTAVFALAEPPIPGDPATALPQYPWANGYAAPGVAEAEVVYAHYGLPDDYAALAERGIDVEGAVVLARYGRSYRGVKARLAERHGAAALLLYSDPDDDGYVRGDVVPEGPWRPWHGVQRGSVLDGTGDPTTPYTPSLPGAGRTPPSASGIEIPTIPVVPISYGTAAEILARLRGAALPEEAWQGGLPFRYHVGPGPVRLRVSLDDDRDGPDRGYKPARNVIATVEGSEWPDEVVVVGGHIDAWGPGANDNVSGTVSVLAAARAIASLTAAGEPPRRTIVFAGWDAEEWGLIGSTEWVEHNADRLSAHGVAYLNQDAIGGTRFRAAASPSLKSLIREAARAVTASGERSLHDVWLRGEEAGTPGEVAEPAEPGVSDLGGGSDFAPFSAHLGIPSVNHGFASPGGVYHSAYDTWRWMAEHGDPGFTHHALSSRLVALLALRLADVELLPYDIAALARQMAGQWDPLRAEAREAGLLDEAAARRLDGAWSALERVGAGWKAARDRYLAGEVDAARSR
ncbi:MAG: M20/M25/M40 family metallo-hydrolase, partial [Gemmatimonadota bacterium]|nr:M20/M25/M40 family metallo-hydrolase [Gemmatimonadota bacterium]